MDSAVQGGWQSTRLYPRVPVTLPVEIRAGTAIAIGETVNLSAGGLLISSDSPLSRDVEMWVRLNLPAGDSIHSRIDVVHRPGKRRMGVQFVDLSPEELAILSAFTRKILGYSRRGSRIPRRITLTIRRAGTRPGEGEELAETVVISRRGGLLTCRAHFKIGEPIVVSWPQNKRNAEARVVFRQLTGTAGIVELGFEFVKADNFWDMDFLNDSGTWELPQG